jgi:hypothetical protein
MSRQINAPKIRKIALGIFAVVVIIVIVAVATDPDEKPSPKSRKERIENQFSAWDGDHKKLKEYIKETLKDPDSYKNIKTVYWDRDSVIVVKTEYTATNSFGGRVRGTTLAQVDLDGNILKIVAAE